MKELMTIEEVAKKFKVSTRTIRRRMDDKKLPCIRKVGKLLFDPDQVEKWLNS